MNKLTKKKKPCKKKKTNTKALNSIGNRLLMLSQIDDVRFTKKTQKRLTMTWEDDDTVTRLVKSNNELRVFIALQQQGKHPSYYSIEKELVNIMYAGTDSHPSCEFINTAIVFDLPSGKLMNLFGN